VQTQDIRQANLILQSTSFDPNSCETSLSTSNTIAHHNAGITSIAIDFQYDLNALNQIDPDTNEYKYKAGTYVFADLYGNAIKPVILNSLSLSLNIHHDAKNFWYDQRN
jgi:hypothetical protein